MRAQKEEDEKETIVNSRCLLSHCHSEAASEVEVYVMAAGEKSGKQIGNAWICEHQDWQAGGSRSCNRTVTRTNRQGESYDIKTFRNIPPEFSRALWDKMKSYGPWCAYEAGFGFHCIYDGPGNLIPYTRELWENKIKSMFSAVNANKLLQAKQEEVKKEIIPLEQDRKAISAQMVERDEEGARIVQEKSSKQEFILPENWEDEVPF